MITSSDNDKLKLIRKLADRKHRDREGLFVAEGEDLVAAAEAAGMEAEFVLRAGEDVEPELLDSISSLGSGTRVVGVYPERWAESVTGAVTYLHGVGDPGNVGTIIRTAEALVGGCVVLGGECADPYGPKAVRASMGAIFAEPVLRGSVDSTPGPRAALVAHGGDTEWDTAGVATLCLGAEREGLPEEVLEACEHRWTIPLREGAESLNVAAAAAIALWRISSAARGGTD